MTTMSELRRVASPIAAKSSGLRPFARVPSPRYYLQDYLVQGQGLTRLVYPIPDSMVRASLVNNLKQARDFSVRLDRVPHREVSRSF